MSLELIRASNGSGESVRSIVTGLRSVGSTTLSVDSLTNWPTNFIATSGTLLSDGTLDPATVTVFEGHKNVSQIVIDGFAPGYSDLGNTVGQVVVVKPTTHWADTLVDVIDLEHNADGTHNLLNGAVVSEVGFYKGATYFTSPGTYSKPANLKFIIVEVQAGGGGSGGTAATASGSGGNSGAGGGGGYSRKKILAADLAASETVTVGAAGAAGAVGNNAGGTGGSSSFGAHLSATGGAGGAGSLSGSGNNSYAGGAGGSGSGGDLNISGSSGNFGFVYAGQWMATAIGGSSQLGRGGMQTVAGSAYGGGGGGRAAGSSSAAQSGLAGAPGIVIVHEYF